jgi:diguanylate cyclase (GGDEF)-like protein
MNIELSNDTTTEKIPTNMMYSATDPSGEKIYYVEYDPRYIPEEQLENIQRKSNQIKETENPEELITYIPLEQEDFKGARVSFNKQGTPLNLYFSREIDRVIDLQNSMTVDPLTEVDNRLGWNIAIEKLADMIQREEMNDRYITFGVFDLNNLKKINDEQGHSIGDEYILQMAQYLKNVFRSYDEIARWGGDEFSVFTVSNEDITDTIVDRLNETQTSNLNYSAGILGFSVNSILQELGSRTGIDIKERTKLVRDILRRKFNEADQLMYEAKEASKNQQKEGINPTIIQRETINSSQ